jgi:hypothetical protein
MRLEIWGQRKHSTDKRLDWLFPERREKNVEKGKQDKALKEAIAKEDEEDEEMFLARMAKQGGAGAGKEKGGGGDGKSEQAQVRTRLFRSSC